MRRVLALLLISALLISAGCKSGGASSADLKDKGFTQIQSYKEDAAQVTIYTGMVSSKDATDTFGKWAKDEGWKEREDGFEYFAGYSGLLFEKNKEIMMINIVDAGASTTVMVMIVAEDTQTPKTTTAARTEAYKPVFHKFDSIFELSDTFKEVTGLIFDHAFEYEFMGRTEIDGNTAEHIKISTNSLGEAHTLIELWVDEKNTKIYKALSNGEEVPETQASSAGILLSYLDFFFAGNVWDPTWEESTQTETTTDLGAGRINVEVYELIFEDLALVQIYEIAEVSGKYVVISYFSYEDDKKDNGEGWEITRLVPR